MATNITGDYRMVWEKSLICSHPATPLSGQPVRIGSETGIAVTNEATTTYDASGNVSGNTSVWTGFFRAKLSVKGVNDGGNSAVADGDSLFYVDADVNDGTGFLSKKSSGYFYGFARGAVNSGATATIPVDHVPSPGAGTLGSGTVGTANLAAGAVTAAKLSTTLATGMIQLPLASAREISSNDIINTAGDAGMLSSNTTPILQRVNAATDKKLRLNWAASNNDEIVWDFTYPPDLDDAAAVTVNIFAASGGATNSPVVAVSYFEGVGDTNAGGNTAAVTGTTPAKYTVTIAASDVGAYPNGASIGLVPAAHTTDALYIYAAWIEYTRK